MKKRYFLNTILFLFLGSCFFLAGELFAQIQSIAKENEPSKIYKISWPEVMYAKTYIIQITNDPYFSESGGIYEFEIPENYLEIELPFGIFYLRIAGKNEDGELGLFSNVIKIIVEDRILEYYDDNAEIYSKPEIDEDNIFNNLAYIRIVGDPNENVDETDPNLVSISGLGDTSKPLVFEYPDEICLNLFYYLGINHFHNGNETLAIFYFELLDAISKDYKPSFKIEPESKTLSNGREILYSKPENYELHKVIIALIETYIENGKKMESQNEYEKALKYYKKALSFDPYNKMVLEKINAILNL